MAVKPHLRDATIFWRPGNLNLARRSASWAWAKLASLQRTDKMIWPISTRAQVPCEEAQTTQLVRRR